MIKRMFPDLNSILNLRTLNLQLMRIGLSDEAKSPASELKDQGLGFTLIVVWGSGFSV